MKGRSTGRCPLQGTHCKDVQACLLYLVGQVWIWQGDPAECCKQVFRDLEGKASYVGTLFLLYSSVESGSFLKGFQNSGKDCSSKRSLYVWVSMGEVYQVWFALMDLFLRLLWS